ncbi:MULTISPECIES: alpha/beta hydrolase [Legionella]|uniref:Alpha/beta fold hydrolase n=1 Tax=Legionella septentrionalis TaxID=2498109 RepID=A0A3S0WZS9_9GAMM|nr:MULTISPECIES: alpha/beta fold hydrolase [Legionella]MCP0914521.1 alpha/beta fold hydrolase [Legionella sp. 27cVA30]RUQ85004.1 alpha/beta fold hydrolase [Legionella septentrionalis]RUR02361.1 alpha/beta fold hydrolase [Legionella septentrionalis]RUR10304.1 alpha/beta fold hydrolase [Legionella septentrionalis]RUR17018.1 alpha/beta fold hydrolase [Legionella septentrionalis]
MITDSLKSFRDFLYSHICYQLFITPVLFPLEKEYREFARRACEYLQKERTESLHCDHPRHHVVHHFAAPRPGARKILITHGWMSRAAYMARLIRALHQQGFDVYALDFPAHGEAKGLQLLWTDAITTLQRTLNELGPFYGVIGHSFGGSVILNTLNLGRQYPNWKINKEPERVVMLASPTRMRTPIIRLARQFKLTGKGFLLLRKAFRDKTNLDPKSLDFRNYTKHAHTPFLCIHGEKDEVITPRESIIFCKQYSFASLALLPNVDHIGVLLDARVEDMVSNFLHR